LRRLKGEEVPRSLIRIGRYPILSTNVTDRIDPNGRAEPDRPWAKPVHPRSPIGSRTSTMARPVVPSPKGFFQSRVPIQHFERLFQDRCGIGSCRYVGFCLKGFRAFGADRRARGRIGIPWSSEISWSQDAIFSGASIPRLRTPTSVKRSPDGGSLARLDQRECGEELTRRSICSTCIPRAGGILPPVYRYPKPIVVRKETLVRESHVYPYCGTA